MSEQDDRKRLAAEHQAMRLRVLRECLRLAPLLRAIEPSSLKRRQLFRVPGNRTRVA